MAVFVWQNGVAQPWQVFQDLSITNYGAGQAPVVAITLEDVLLAISKLGFRREQISRQKMMSKIEETLAECIDLRTELRRLKSKTGDTDASQFLS